MIRRVVLPLVGVALFARRSAPAAHGGPLPLAVRTVACWSGQPSRVEESSAVLRAHELAHLAVQVLLFALERGALLRGLPR